MDDWLDRFAATLGVPPLEPAEVDAILDLARQVAHGTERKNAPLAAWLAGRSGADVATASAVARETLAAEGHGENGDGRP